MPYIKAEDRTKLSDPRNWAPDCAGELNYVITKTILDYLAGIEGGFRYQHINDVIGALEGAKSEFYRRVVIPYENKKAVENGDVYESFLKENKLA